MSNYNFSLRADGAYDLSVNNDANPPGVPPPPPGVPPPPAPPPGVPPSSGAFTLLSATQWKPEVGQPDVVFGRTVDGAPANTYCQLITSGAVGIGPFRVVVPMNVLPGATTAGGNVAGITYGEAPGEHNAFGHLSISADQNPAVYLTGDSNSNSASICYGEVRPGVPRLADGNTYAIFDWRGEPGVSSNKLLEISRFA